MREYTVYWIKDEFVRHYYYKNDILFRFFKEHLLDQSRIDLTTQFHFITESFPNDMILKEISEDKHFFQCNIDGNLVEIRDAYSYITLHIDEKQIKFRCETLQDAEALLFPILKRFHPNLFIMENNYDNFGWISPARMSISYNNEQVLYS